MYPLHCTATAGIGKEHVRIIDEDGDTVVGRICGKYQRDCGIGGKSAKIGTVDAKEVLNDFRYSAKLNLCPGVHKMTTSKMATNRSVEI